MIRKVTGWILMIAGGVYLALLAAQGLYWLVDRNHIEVHIPTLAISIVLVSAGTIIRGWGQRSVHK